MTGGGTRKFHLVFVSRELGIFQGTGGIGTYVWDLARCVVKEGHRCTVICSSYTPNGKGDETREGVRVITIPEGHLLSRNPLSYPIRFKKQFFGYRNRVADTLDGLIDTTGVDLVEFAEYGAESFVWQDRPRRIPMVVRWHTPIGRQFKLANVVYYPIKRWMRWATLQTLFSAEAITFPSQWMADRVAETVDLGRLFYRVIPNGVNYLEWSFQAPSGLEEAKREINVLYAGTLAARKGFVDLINAVKILRRDGYPVILTLLGKHTRHAKMVIWRERSGIAQGWLRAPGTVDRGQLGRYYAEADVCCFPSWFETVGIVCLEAMACGGIVIGSANSGMAEVIEDGKDGFLAPPKAPKELALIIKKALSLPPEKKLEMRRQAGQKILKTFDNSIILKQALDFYRAVIARFGHN